MPYENIIIYLCISSVLFYAGIIILFRQVSKLKDEKIDSGVTSIIHIGTGNVPIRKLDLTKTNGIVIGRQSGDEKPDFDLSDGEESGSVAVRHAVLNCVNDVWYVEALEYIHPVGLRKAGDSVVYRLKVLTPYRVEAGDIIYLSHEKVMLK